jgi:hypothetical protein
MKSQSEIKEMLDYITVLQQDAEHKLDEHFLMPHERQKYVKTLEDTAREAEVLQWVPADEEVAFA